MPSLPSKCLRVQHCAQAHGISLGVGQVIVIAITATLAAIGAASIPMSALVSMITVLQAVRPLGQGSSSYCVMGLIFFDKCIMHKGLLKVSNEEFEFVPAWSNWLSATPGSSIVTQGRMLVSQVGMSEYVKDLSVILAVDWCARPALLLQPGTRMLRSKVLKCFCYCTMPLPAFSLVGGAEIEAEK